jgi:hypothetical protein
MNAKIHHFADISLQKELNSQHLFLEGLEIDVQMSVLEHS